ncbi:dynamin family protein [Streptococcus parauberis]|uniref:dynamin family protein n=1 Tax=Streptococcus parauberis TaxID=1348 RepID=UPI00288F8CE1|nr:dynamin family protein [Streptococcus parauberis]MDT2749625.1 dynamin family protein [Streptococcus parauberis]
MTKIKIISNPYEEEINFSIYNDSSNESQDITISGYNGDLINSSYKTGFFPFNVKNIVDTIKEDFNTPDESLELEFEGTKDEFDELDQLLTDDKFGYNIKLTNSSKTLANARDILPKVIEVFNKVYPLIETSISDNKRIESDLNKFSEASNADIPIYLIGNYSAGKSTFINSIVGYEFLPSSAKPTTAKIYKITHSNFEDTSKLEFLINNCKVSIVLRDNDFQLETILPLNDFMLDIKNKLSGLSAKNNKEQLRIVLDIINEEANNKKSEYLISDLIEVEIPFSDKGILGNSKDKIVIFDTPGSDTANNDDHRRILSKALVGLSNGLPIVVSEYESLDRINADILADEINSVKELDNRFTMIVVNKADSARLSDFSEDEVMDFVVPRKLYSSGIFFVSSLIGLGSKNGEKFEDIYNAEIFSDQKHKYLNENSDFSKHLYEYNIMPQQIRERYELLSNESNNPLYTNSGLEEVERAINDFVKIYSSYNKCQQSKLFLNKILEIITVEIKNKKDEKTIFRNTTNDELKEGEKKLLVELDILNKELQKKYESDYPERIQNVIESISANSHVNFKENYNKYREKGQNEKNVGRYISSKNNTKIELIKDVKESLKIFKNGPEYIISNSKNVAKEIIGDIKDYNDLNKELITAKKEAEEFASDELISSVRSLFSENVNQARVDLENASSLYWNEKSKDLKKQIANLISNSDDISIVEREKLNDLVVLYEDFDIEKEADQLFDKNKFSYFILKDKLGLNIPKLENKFSKSLNTEVNKSSDILRIRHNDGFVNWSISLLNHINDNIVNLNPYLRQKSAIIRDFDKEINELNERMEKIVNYTEEVKNMMDWKSLN